MYEITNSRESFSDELTNCLIDEAGLKQLQCQISIYKKYSSDGSKLVMLFCVDYCVYWYKSEEL